MRCYTSAVILTGHFASISDSHKKLHNFGQMNSRGSVPVAAWAGHVETLLFALSGAPPGNDCTLAGHWSAEPMIVHKCNRHVELVFTGQRLSCVSRVWNLQMSVPYE